MLKPKVRSLSFSAAVGASFAIAFATPAHAVVVVAGPGGFAAGYATPVVVAPVGGPLEFVNGDIQPHNVIADEDFLDKKTAKKTDWCMFYAKKKCPIFWSETVPLGGSAEVLGLENTESGQQYSFYCSLHPGMRGTLVAL